MTAGEPRGVPGLPPVRLLTAAEYATLSETGWGYTELLEGRILVSPSPTAKHNMAGLALAMQLVPQLPEGVRLIQDVPAGLPPRRGLRLRGLSLSFNLLRSGLSSRGGVSP